MEILKGIIAKLPIAKMVIIIKDQENNK